MTESDNKKMLSLTMEETQDAGFPDDWQTNGKRATIFNSVTKCRDLENSISLQESTPEDPIGTLLLEVPVVANVFKGKIIDINREFGAEITKGFSMGKLTIEGLGEYKGKEACVDFSE